MESSAYSLSEVTQQLSLMLAMCQPGPLEWEAAGSSSLNFPPLRLLWQDQGFRDSLVQAACLNCRAALSDLSAPSHTWPDHWWHLQRKWWNVEVYMTTEHAHPSVLNQGEPSQRLLCPGAPRSSPQLDDLRLPLSLLLHAFLRGRPLNRA